MPISNIPLQDLSDIVDGPADSVNNEIVRYDGTTGKVIKGTSGATISVSGNTLEFNRDIQSSSYNCESSDLCHISSRPTDQTEANPNIVTINSVNFGAATNGGYISVNSKFDGFPNWVQTSASAVTTAQFIKLAPEQFSIRFGDATNTDGVDPGTDVFNCVPTAALFKQAIFFKTTEVTTTTYNVLSTDYHLFVNRQGPTTINLPDASIGISGRVLKITDFSGFSYSDGAITVTPNGTDLINGQNVPFRINKPYQTIEVVLQNGKWFVTSLFDRNKGDNLIRASINSSLVPFLNLLDDPVIQFNFEDNTIDGLPLYQMTLISDVNLRLWYSGTYIISGVSTPFACPAGTGLTLTAGDTLTFSNSSAVNLGYIGITTALNLSTENDSVMFNQLEMEINSGNAQFVGRRLVFDRLSLAASSKPSASTKSIMLNYSWRGD